MIITTSLDRNSSSNETRSFIEEFETKAGFKADMVTASGHNAMKAAAAAMQAAGSTEPKALRDAIAAINLTASTGDISFNGLGEVRKDVQVQVVKDGNWRHHSVISGPELLSPPE